MKTTEFSKHCNLHYEGSLRHRQEKIDILPSGTYAQTAHNSVSDAQTLSLNRNIAVETYRSFSYQLTACSQPVNDWLSTVFLTGWRGDCPKSHVSPIIRFEFLP